MLDRTRSRKRKHADPDATITTKDTVVTKAVDCRESSTRLLKVLSVEPHKRQRFLTMHADAKDFLLKHPENPIAEEGYVLRNEKRSRVGELFITPDAFQKLCMHKFPEDWESQRLSIAIEKDGLQQRLKTMFLDPGEDAVVVYFDYVHAMVLYFRQLESGLHCFLYETQIAGNRFYPCISDIYSSAKHAKIFVNTAVLQYDHYSCTVFAFKAAKYFLKHGEEVFPYLLEQPGVQQDPVARHVYLLPPEALMPALLKMSATKINLPEEKLEAVVSEKKGTTLGEYWEKHHISDNKKQFNTAALVKRYGLIAELDKILKEEKVTEAAEAPKYKQ